MFIGHFGVAFAAKPSAPRVSLGSLFLAAQFLDLLWPTLLLLGLERVRIAPGITAVTPLDFEHYPISHSLVMVIVWALLVSTISFLLTRYRRGAVAVGLLVVSHWILDAVVHRPDLPLYPGGASRIGLGLWSSLPGTIVVEVLLFAVGVWLYVRDTRGLDAIGRWALAALVVFLPIVYAVNLFGPPPTSVTTLAWVAQTQWLLVAWGYWIDRHRRALHR